MCLLPEGLQHVQRFWLAVLLALNQTDARMGHCQELNVGVLSSPLAEQLKMISALWINNGLWRITTYRNGVKTGEIERPFFSHLHNVALERNFVVAIGGVLGRDAVIVQHLLQNRRKMEIIRSR